MGQGALPRVRLLVGGEALGAEPVQGIWSWHDLTFGGHVRAGAHRQSIEFPPDEQRGEPDGRLLLRHIKLTP
jgi:hypothetical protein